MRKRAKFVRFTASTSKREEIINGAPSVFSQSITYLEKIFYSENGFLHENKLLAYGPDPIKNFREEFDLRV